MLLTTMVGLCLVTLMMAVAGPASGAAETLGDVTTDAALILRVATAVVEALAADATSSEAWYTGVREAADDLLLNKRLPTLLAKPAVT